MQPTSFDTINVLIAGSTTPTVLAKATLLAIRVLIQNVGASLIFVSQDVNDISPAPTTATFRIPAGVQIVFVLAPKQTLYAVATGIGGLASVSSSEALVIERS